MPQARHKLVCLKTTPFYHCVSRCVRRAYLCGKDPISGRNLGHRKQWIRDRLSQLSKVFAVDIYAFAIMSNHFHLVVKINCDAAAQWTDDNVINRWSKLFALPPLVQRYWKGEEISYAERKSLDKIVSVWRTRLHSLSWFMRALNEFIARRANHEDQCTGRFWEGRYKSQAILDQAALLAVMAYVDLNPIRAGTAQSLKSSAYTSIRDRLMMRDKHHQCVKKRVTLCQKGFLPPLRPNDSLLPISLTQYIELLEWTARRARHKNTDRRNWRQPRVLTRNGIKPGAFLRYTQCKHEVFCNIVGHIEHIRQMAASFGRRFLKGQTEAGKLFLQPTLLLTPTN